MENSESPNQKLYNLIEHVKDQESFLIFAKALRDDRWNEDKIDKVDVVGRGELGWENHDIGGFLDAAIAWADSTDFGDKQDLKDANPWKKFAVFLYLGKIYE